MQIRKGNVFVAVGVALSFAACAGISTTTPSKVSAPTATDVIPSTVPQSDPHTVVVGTKVDQFGTGFLDTATYDYSGLDVDVAKYISGILFSNSDPYFLPVSSDTRELALISDAVTFFVATYTIESNRAKNFDLAGPYLVTTQGVMVGPHSPKISKAEDLVSNHTPACVVGNRSESERVLKGSYPGVITKPDNDYSDCLSDLRAGNVQAFSADLAILYGYLGNSSNSDMHIVKSIDIGNPIYYGIAFRKSDHALCLKAAKAIKDMVHNGQWDKYFDNNLREYEADFPEYRTRIKPNDKEIDANSCKNS